MAQQTCAISPFSSSPSCNRAIVGLYKDAHITRIVYFISSSL
jgi:hypothetical protein